MKCSLTYFAVTILSLLLVLNARTGDAKTPLPAAQSVRAVAIEVLIVNTQGKEKKEFAAGLSGPTAEVVNRLNELESNGQIGNIDRVMLTTIERQPTVVQAGITQPIPIARMAGGRGGPQTSYQQKNVGTLVSATAEIEGSVIAIELEIEQTRLESPVSDSASDQPFKPSVTKTLTSQTTLLINDGQTMLVSGVEKRAGGQSTAQLILVAARLLDTPATTSSVDSPSDQPSRQIKIFSLKFMAADDAAKIIRGLFVDKRDRFTFSADARTNSLIVMAEKASQLEVIEAILMKLDSSSGSARQAPQPPQRNNQGGSAD